MRHDGYLSPHMRDELASCFKISLSGHTSPYVRTWGLSWRRSKSHWPTGDRGSRALYKSSGFEELIDRYPHELSGGEQQRVALARAVVGEPQILLLDEPLSSLDAELRATLRQELARLQRTLQLTAIYVTHDREDASALADFIVEMRAGRIVSVSEMKRRERG